LHSQAGNARAEWCSCIFCGLRLTAQALPIPQVLFTIPAVQRMYAQQAAGGLIDSAPPDPAADLPTQVWFCGCFAGACAAFASASSFCLVLYRSGQHLVARTTSACCVS
jgi:hypothetical protein